MKNTLYAVVAACLAMFATSGIVALATAAPATPPPTADQELIAHLDGLILAQLDEIELRLGLPAVNR